MPWRWNKLDLFKNEQAVQCGGHHKCPSTIGDAIRHTTHGLGHIGTSNVRGHGKYCIFNTIKIFWMTLIVILSGPSPTCREQIKGSCKGRQEDGLEGF